MSELPCSSALARRRDQISVEKQEDHLGVVADAPDQQALAIRPEIALQDLPSAVGGWVCHTKDIRERVQTVVVFPMPGPPLDVLLCSFEPQLRGELARPQDRLGQDRELIPTFSAVVSFSLLHEPKVMTLAPEARDPIRPTHCRQAIAAHCIGAQHRSDALFRQSIRQPFPVGLAFRVLNGMRLGHCAMYPGGAVGFNNDMPERRDIEATSVTFLMGLATVGIRPAPLRKKLDLDLTDADP
ncbi:hypothetical protein QF118_07175 [Tropicibacter oceani]|uniref:Uncharacterized protein n=2 Tax=Tropicibacter oceani TaxID=3058420 RepID=A0ABY8QL05_9RHOB|nr:hypothetical protein [Tropicibacter oceani]WGW05321.1 hypothetical protein QF118_07175 [Tropicibacter oceani]